MIDYQLKSRVKFIPLGSTSLPWPYRNLHSRPKMSQKSARMYKPQPEITGRWRETQGSVEVSYLFTRKYIDNLGYDNGGT